MPSTASPPRGSRERSSAGEPSAQRVGGTGGRRVDHPRRWLLAGERPAPLPPGRALPVHRRSRRRAGAVADHRPAVALDRGHLGTAGLRRPGPLRARHRRPRRDRPPCRRSPHRRRARSARRGRTDAPRAPTSTSGPGPRHDPPGCRHGGRRGDASVRALRGRVDRRPRRPCRPPGAGRVRDPPRRPRRGRRRLLCHGVRRRRHRAPRARRPGDDGHAHRRCRGGVRVGRRRPRPRRRRRPQRRARPRASCSASRRCPRA